MNEELDYDNALEKIQRNIQDVNDAVTDGSYNRIQVNRFYLLGLLHGIKLDAPTKVYNLCVEILNQFEHNYPCVLDTDQELYNAGKGKTNEDKTPGSDSETV